MRQPPTKCIKHSAGSVLHCSFSFLISFGVVGVLLNKDQVTNNTIEPKIGQICIGISKEIIVYQNPASGVKISKPGVEFIPGKVAELEMREDFDNLLKVGAKIRVKLVYIDKSNNYYFESRVISRYNYVGEYIIQNKPNIFITIEDGYLMFQENSKNKIKLAQHSPTQFGGVKILNAEHFSIRFLKNKDAKFDLVINYSIKGSDGSWTNGEKEKYLKK